MSGMWWKIGIQWPERFQYSCHMRKMWRSFLLSQRAWSLTRHIEAPVKDYLPEEGRLDTA
jgi:hypothetical protein